MHRLALRLLGKFEARQGAGGQLALRLAKSRALLAYIALSEGQMVSRGRLCDLLWSRVDRHQARQSLRQALADIRDALGPASTILVTGEDAVGLDRGRVVCDVALFERLAATRRRSALARAARLYHGIFLDGIDLNEPAFEDWRESELRRLDTLARRVLARLYEMCDRDSADSAIALASRLVVVDPYDEAGHQTLMKLYARYGAKREALRQFEICRRNLRDGLDQEPLPETIALHEVIRQAEGPDRAADEPVRDLAIASMPGSVRRTYIIAPAVIIAITIAGFAAWQAMQPQSPVVEAAERNSPEQLETYDSVLGAAHQMYTWDEEIYVTAKSLLENVLELDPNNARALRELAYLRYQAWFRGHEEGQIPPEELKEMAVRASDLNPASPQAHLVAAYAYFFDHQLDLFEHEARKTFELAPYDGRIFAELGTMIGYTGQWERGLNLIQKSQIAHTLLVCNNSGDKPSRDSDGWRRPLAWWKS